MTDKKIFPPPSGMEPYDVKTAMDLGALNENQQEQLHKYKVYF